MTLELAEVNGSCWPAGSLLDVKLPPSGPLLVNVVPSSVNGRVGNSKCKWDAPAGSAYPQPGSAPGGFGCRRPSVAPCFTAVPVEVTPAAATASASKWTYPKMPAAVSSSTITCPTESGPQVLRAVPSATARTGSLWDPGPVAGWKSQALSGCLPPVTFHVAPDVQGSLYDVAFESEIVFAGEGAATSASPTLPTSATRIVRVRTVMDYLQTRLDLQDLNQAPASASDLRSVSSLPSRERPAFAVTERVEHPYEVGVA